MRNWLIAVLALFAFAAGCADAPDPWRTRGDRLLGLGGEDAEDPVTGAMVEKSKSVKRDYRGTTYHFESTETAEIFDRNPANFAVTENRPLEEHEAR